jgi:hypothetical protein
MSDVYIERIMMLASCSEEEANQAFSKTNDVIDAVDMIISVPVTRGAPKQKILTEEQVAFQEIRKNFNSPIIKKSIIDSEIEFVCSSKNLLIV